MGFFEVCDDIRKNDWRIAAELQEFVNRELSEKGRVLIVPPNIEVDGLEVVRGWSDKYSPPISTTDIAPIAQFIKVQLALGVGGARGLVEGCSPNFVYLLREMIRSIVKSNTIDEGVQDKVLDTVKYVDGGEHDYSRIDFLGQSILTWKSNKRGEQYDTNWFQSKLVVAVSLMVHAFLNGSMEVPKEVQEKIESYKQRDAALSEERTKLSKKMLDRNK